MSIKKKPAQVATPPFAVSDNPRALSPLRFPGGKRWIAPHVERVIQANKLDLRLFVEPFAGGASVALHLLHTDQVEAIGLMDRDPLIASFWKVVFFDTDWLVRKILKTPVTLSLWNHLKKRSLTSDRERAFACLFLNRTSFSGILNSRAGPLGGQSQLSSYKIDCRYPQQDLAERIRWLGDTFRDRVLFVWNWSWKRGLAELLKNLGQEDKAKAKILVYLDPPFYKKAEQLYNHYFTASEHEHLRDFLATFELPWFLSYDNCLEVRKLYQGMSSVSVNCLYNASRLGKNATSRKKTSELVVTNLEANFTEIKFPNRRVRGTEIAIMEDEPRVGSFAY